MLVKIFIFIFGSCLGSFLNVCIHRMPKEKSIVKPRSSCPKCNSLIKWYDNIPIISYLLLKGRCRICHEKISFRYLLVELLSGLILLVLYLKFGFSLEMLKYAFLFYLLLLVSFIDIDYHAIPASLCVIGILGGLLLSLWTSIGFLRIGILDFSKLPIAVTLKGLLFGLGFTYFFKLFGDVFIDLYLKVCKKESIEGERESLGLGDVDFMGMVGVFLGAKSVILVFFLAPFFAIFYSIFALIFKRSHLIPYLPYLSLATVTAFFWQDKILSFIF